jgi:hypothetical protein
VKLTRSPACVLFVCAAALSALHGCSKADNAPPVATASFAASKPRVPLGGPVELTYTFTVGPNVTIPGDYKVFVHVLDSDGKQIWSDDHDPPVPTSQWKAGQTIGPYTRMKFVPVVPYLGEATVRLGLYKGNDRLPLTGSDPADRNSTSREYKVGTLELLPSSENVFVRYTTGWHPSEYAVENPSNTWQWTQKLASISVRNPRKDATLYLDFDARSDVFGDQPQVVTVYSGDQVLATFPADNTAETLKQIPVAAAQLGTGEMTDLRIGVDKTFVPAKLPGGGKDIRELGIRVYHVFVEPK